MHTLGVDAIGIGGDLIAFGEAGRDGGGLCHAGRFAGHGRGRRAVFGAGHGALSVAAAMLQGMTATTTAADYAGLEEQYAHLMVAFCVTLVRGLTAEELLQRLGAEPEVRATGVEPLSEPSYAVRDPYRLFAEATSVGDWSLVVAPDAAPQLANVACRGTRAPRHRPCEAAVPPPRSPPSPPPPRNSAARARPKVRR
ncbi:DUF6461 domain-containing protein [Streptomyces sp. NL15-2K]|uniref:DUF6461 domain-containing protein n=1 Tax=Streptomyces sp. NL15-2K TaxID=376149 RepID=UPI0035B4FDCE